MFLFIKDRESGHVIQLRYMPTVHYDEILRKQKQYTNPCSKFN